MRRFILSLLVCSFYFDCIGQETIKFLGIPVDGRKTDMISKLTQKGFNYDIANDCLDGVFNGKESTILIHENNGLVDRLMVMTIIPTGLAKSAFNTLLKQFQSNEKYVSSNDNHPIPDEEDVPYELRVNDKNYDAIFYPDPFVEGGDKSFQDYIANTAARLALESAASGELINPTDERIRQLTALIADRLIIKTATGVVWFRLVGLSPGSDSAIYIFYDNLTNQNHGEDL